MPQSLPGELVTVREAQGGCALLSTPPREDAVTACRPNPTEDFHLAAPTRSDAHAAEA